jgi:N-acetylmuramoyl-L-alanine amidase
VRLVVDLKQPALPQVFNLSPVAAYKHRLVVDLYPPKAADPLEALIAERLKEKPGRVPPPAPRAPRPDPLGELIGRPERPQRVQRPRLGRCRRRVSRPALALAKTDRLIIVALDPGHGGEDPGAVGPGGTREKDVVLQIAHLLRERINGMPSRATRCAPSSRATPTSSCRCTCAWTRRGACRPTCSSASTPTPS